MTGRMPFTRSQHADRCLQALALRDKGMNHEWIAARLGIAVKRVSSMLVRGKEIRLRQDDLARRAK